MKHSTDFLRKKLNPRGVVTVLLQDYFHRGVFRTFIGEKQWSRFESRLDRNVDDTIELLDKYNIKATFFTLGWIGERFPALIKRLADEDHEVASAGFWARSVAEMNPEQFREDVQRSRMALETASGKKVIGYRCAYRYIRAREWWALSILSEEGHIYDASYCPPLISQDANKPLRQAQQLKVNGGSIWEFPICTKSVLGLKLPMSGGNYLRQFPHRMMFGYFKEWLRREDSPFVLYFHPWELDVEQPVISAVGAISRMRQYRNLGKMRTLLPDYFRSAKFMPIRDYLNVRAEDAPRECAAERYTSLRLHLPSIVTKKDSIRTCVSVIVPCYNEESSLPYLEKALAELETAAAPRFDIGFIFVDDCSTDRTLEELEQRFGKRRNCTVIRHKCNRGIAKAIATGIGASTAEVVCSMDADCSYDPLELVRMVQDLDDDTDMVTASPYHPEGFIIAVPNWRLFLSKSLSRLYNLLLRNKLSTYTSCFRVYRKSAVENIYTDYSDFRGILELLARLDIGGGRIKEFPTTLQSRIFGYSKMKTIATIFGHVGLLFKIFHYKMRYRRQPTRTDGQKPAADKTYQL